MWHDFEPDRAALKAGPWFPYLELNFSVHLSNHCVHRSKPTKSAGKTNLTRPRLHLLLLYLLTVRLLQQLRRTSMLHLAPQKKARHDEAGDFK